MDAGQVNTSYHILFRVVSGSMAVREDCWYFLSYTVYESGFAKYSFGLRLIPSPVVGAERERVVAQMKHLRVEETARRGDLQGQRLIM